MASGGRSQIRRLISLPVSTSLHLARYNPKTQQVSRNGNTLDARFIEAAAVAFRLHNQWRDRPFITSPWRCDWPL
jgi:hypothetical protein